MFGHHASAPAQSLVFVHIHVLYPGPDLAITSAGFFCLIRCPPLVIPGRPGLAVPMMANITGIKPSHSSSFAKVFLTVT
jgi:hypothetical protein